MNEMNEIRVRPRQVLLLVLLFIGLLWFVRRDNSSNSCYLPDYLKLTKFSRIDDLPTIYAITPTYSRPVQKAELTRLSHVFMLVPNLHWIIVEDANTTSSLVKNLLHRSGMEQRSTVLNVKTPQEFKLQGKDPNWSKPRGVEQRNLALQWVRANAKPDIRSVVYFMDDDNSYSVELFYEMSLINEGRVGVWPVGLVGGLKVEKPIVDKENKVIGFNAVWRPDRPFPVDMAGFAISTDLLFRHPKACFSYDVQRGFQESEILRHVTVLEDLQPLANNCKEVLVWHTRTEKPKLTEEDKLTKKGKSSVSDGMEV